MPTAFVLLAPIGTIAWRVLRPLGVPRGVIKATHAFLMQSAGLIAAVGIGYIIHAEQQRVSTNLAEYGQVHFQSVHSWIGIVAFSLFVLNSISAPLFFYNPLASDAARKAYLPLHVFMGIVAVALTLASVALGMLSYAARGTGGVGTSHPIPGGMLAATEYKTAALLLTFEAVCIYLVFFVSEPGWAAPPASIKGR